MKQEQSERIDEFVLKLCECMRECRFPEDIQDKLLLNRVIYSNKHDTLIQKFVSKGEELTLQRVVDMIRVRESADQHFKEIKL